MSEMTGKIRFKIGKLEIEYEGRESFLINDLSKVLASITDFYKEHSVEQIDDQSTDTETVKSLKEKDHKFDFSTSTIASRMEANSGPDLIIAASAYLTFVRNEDEFSRTDILSEMKNASGFFNKNMASNLTSHLNRLVKNKLLNETASGKYALSASEKGAMEMKLA